MSHVGNHDPLDQERRVGGLLPDGVHAIGVPTARSGHNAFILAAAAVVALLALIFTLSWIVYHQLTPGPAQPGQPGQSTQSPPGDGVSTQAFVVRVA